LDGLRAGIVANRADGFLVEPTTRLFPLILHFGVAGFAGRSRMYGKEGEMEMRNATKSLLLAAAVFGLAVPAHADDQFCFDQYFVYASELLPTLEQAVGSAVVTYKLGEKTPCFFLLGYTTQDKSVPIEGKTVFELASVTKVFTTGILGMHTEF